MAQHRIEKNFIYLVSKVTTTGKDLGKLIFSVTPIQPVVHNKISGIQGQNGELYLLYEHSNVATKCYMERTANLKILYEIKVAPVATSKSYLM